MERMSRIVWCLVILAAVVKISDGLIRFGKPELINSNYSLPPSDTEDGIFVNNGHIWFPQTNDTGTMSTLDSKTDQWSYKDFNITTTARRWMFVAMNSTLFMVAILEPAANGKPVQLGFSYWDENDGQLKNITTVSDLPASNLDTEVVNVRMTVPDPDGSIAYVAISSITTNVSEAIFAKLDIQFGEQFPISAKVSNITSMRLEGLPQQYVNSLAIYKDTLYAFTLYKPGDRPLLNFNSTIIVDLNSSNAQAVLVPLHPNNSTVRGGSEFWINNEVLAYGRRLVDKELGIWSFNIDQRKWRLTNFAFPSEIPTWLTFDQSNQKVYLHPIGNETYVVSAKESVLSINPAQTIGKVTTTNGFKVSPTNRTLKYINGNLWYIRNFIGNNVSVVSQFDINAKKWIQNRNFTSFHPKFTGTNYFGLNDHLFGCVIYKRWSEVDLGIDLYYWNNGTGEFRNISVELDPSSIPFGNTTFRDYTINVPRGNETDVYVAMNSPSTPNSETVFFKVRVKFDENKIPIKAIVTAFDRMTLPEYTEVRTMAIRDKVLYSFLLFEKNETYGSLNFDYAHTFDFNTNVSGNITTTGEDRNLSPYNEVFLIGDDLLLAFGWTYKGSGEPLPYDNSTSSLWQHSYFSFDFKTRHWEMVDGVEDPKTLQNDMFTVDQENRIMYRYASGVKVADIVV